METCGAAEQSLYGDNFIIINETGVFPSDRPVVRSLAWKPCLELMDGPDTPDANLTPSLPFPFDAPRLAMFMLDGPGAFVTMAFGGWLIEPDQGALDSMGIYANRAREAVRAAFAAYHQAVGVVGPSPRAQEAQEAEAHRLYDAAYGSSRVKHNAFRDAVTREQHRILLERVKEEVASQRNHLELAKSNSASARFWWRKFMVKELAQICLSGVAPDGPEEMPTPSLPATTPGPALVVAQSALGGVEPAKAWPVSEKPWLVIDPRDPEAVQPWYTPARYFARQLVMEDSTLLQKRSLLADKVSKSLTDTGFKKRGGQLALKGDTVLKAFSCVVLA